MLAFKLMLIHAVIAGQPIASPSPGAVSLDIAHVGDFDDDVRPTHVSQANTKKAKRDKIRQRIRAMRAWRLTEALDLDETTAAKLFPILNRFDEKMEPVARQGAKLRRQMRKAVKKGAKAADVDKGIDALVAVKKKMNALQEKRFAALRKVVTPVQAAKMLVLLPEIDRAIQREIRKAMRGHNRKRRRREGRRRGVEPDPINNPF